MFPEWQEYQRERRQDNFCHLIARMFRKPSGDPEIRQVSPCKLGEVSQIPKNPSALNVFLNFEHEMKISIFNALDQVDRVWEPLSNVL